ncbi:hypothetical protein KSE1242_01990 [Staphylococcus epidermidis]
MIAKYHHSFMYTSFLFNKSSIINTLKKGLKIRKFNENKKIDKSSYCI